MAKLHEYSDRLNPVFVKEIREGLKSHAFVGAVIGAAFLLLCVTLGGIFDTSSYRQKFPQAWVLVVGIAGLALAQMHAIPAERAGRKLDALSLTRVTPWQIVSGKWYVGCLQMMIIVVLAAPFLAAQYFTGGINLTDNLLWTVLILGFGLAGATLALASGAFVRERAPIHNLIVRLAPVVIGVYTVVFLTNGLKAGTLDHLGTLLGFAVCFAAAALGITLAAVTPGANPGLGLTRIATWLWAVALLAITTNEGVYMIGMLTGGVGMLSYLMENTPGRQVGRTALRRGWRGWCQPGPLLGGLLLFAGLGVLTGVAALVKNDLAIIVAVGWGVAVFPLPFVVLLGRFRMSPAVAYVIIQAVVITLTGIAQSMMHYSDRKSEMAALIPFASMATDSFEKYPAAATVGLLWAPVLGIMLMYAFRRDAVRSDD